MAAVDVIQPDISRLSSFLKVPEEAIRNFTTIQEEYAIVIISSILVKAKEYEDLKSDRLMAEVTLEQTVRSSEGKLKGMKAQLDAVIKESQDLRQKLSAEESKRTALESEVLNAKSSRTNVDEEIRTLRARVQSLESDKRETLEAFQRKNTDYNQLQEEYQAVQRKVIQTRTDAAKLESQLQQSQSSQTSAKFREQNLQQEIQLLKRNNEWLETELNTKTAEFQKFRKEKGVQVAGLQRELEDALSTSEGAKRNSEMMKQRYEEVSRKAEDALQKIKDLQERLVTQEESFRAEMSSQQRLAHLWEQSAKSARDRVRELERTLEDERERESEVIGQAKAETETERAEKDAAEARIAELEVQVERLEADLALYRSGEVAVPIPGTPNRPSNGASTPSRPGSAVGLQFFSPAAAKLQKTGISMTQLYSDYRTAKSELEAERRRNEKLQAHFDELIQELELKAPEIQEQRAEYERLQAEVVEMSLMLEEMGKEKDKAKKAAQKMELKIASYERESAILKQQLRDLGLQVQFLLSEVDHLHSGAEPLSTADRVRLQQYMKGELQIDPSYVETPTDRIISQRLLLFKNIQELQTQNENLLKVTRDLAHRMEEEEKRIKEEAVGQENKRIQEMEQTMERYRDELKSMSTKCQSYIRERDMFRRMLQNRDNRPQQDQEMHTPPPPSEASSAVGAQTIEEYRNLLKDFQAHFDQYKHEAATDHNTLKEQAQKVSQEKSELQLQVAKVQSQLEFAGERYEMLNGNFRMLHTENQELQKRLAQMHEIQAKQDLRAQQVAEELVDTRSLVDSMRNENANLKAEKDLWKKIEERLSADNQSLTLERTRLTAHISNLQTIQAEKERAEDENRRRLLAQVEKLERDLQTATRKLNEEIEESKKAVIRKEAELRDSQKRIEELGRTLGQAREEFVEARTQKDILQARVNELLVELKAVEEKLAVFQRKASVDGNANAEQEAESGSLSREQELEMELADLTKDLEHAKQELENAKEQIEQYKNIARSAEEELETMNSTHDEYKQSMEEEVREYETKFENLEQRIVDITSELTTSNNELTQLRQAEVEKRHRLEDEKSMLESEIKRLRDEADKLSSAASCYQEDLRAQARIAQEAQQNYERELVKHAEAAQALHKFREEYTSLKSEIQGIRSEAEGAKAQLAASETSWDAQKENYEKELSELKTRCDDLAKQNKLLLEQLDNVGTQISALHKRREAVDDELEASIENGETNTEKLYRTLAYLRREKEITDTQYELNLQESKRIKQQLDHVQAQLDEARLLLAQERQRKTHQLQSEVQHKELMDKINELNILRESNMALRSDTERKQKRLQELQQRIDELVAKIRPLEEQVRTLQAEKEVKEEQMKLLQEDNERWKVRTQQILQKYDRVDPAELEAARQQAVTLEQKLHETIAERDQISQQLQVRVTSHQSELENVATSWKAKLDRLVQDTKERLKSIRGQLQERTVERDAIQGELDKLKTTYEVAVAEREKANAARQEVELRVQQGAQAAAANVNLQQQVQANMEMVKKWEEDRAQLLNEKNSLLMRIQTMETDLVNVRRTAEEHFHELAAERKKSSEMTVQIEQLRSSATAPDAAAVTAEATSLPLQSPFQVDVEAIVNERLQAERERLEQERKTIQERVSTARAKFVEYQKVGLEAERQKYEKQLSDKELEHKSSIEKLLQAHTEELEKIKEEIKQQYEERIKELETKLEHAEKVQPIPATPVGLPPQEELKKIVKRNVEHRLGKEREKWEKEAEGQREEFAQARVTEVLQEKIQEKEAEWQAEKQKAIESAKESAKQEAMMRTKVQVSMLEKKNKALEEKVKALEAASGTVSSPTTTTAPQSQQIPTLPPPQHIPHALPPSPQVQLPIQQQQQRAPHTPSQTSQQGSPQQDVPPTPASPMQLQQAPEPVGSNQDKQKQQQPQSSLPQSHQLRVGNVPPAIRSLRGALASNIPRGGPQQIQAGGRLSLGQQGGQQGGIPQPGNFMHGHPSQQGQQGQGQQMGMGVISGQPGQQPQLQPMQHQQPQIQGGRGSQLPRGGMRGNFQGQGRGRGGQQGQNNQQQLGTQGQGIGQIQSGVPQQGTQGGRGPLNPSARQFMPNKRQREEGEVDEGNVTPHPHQGGKRPRGSQGLQQ